MAKYFIRAFLRAVLILILIASSVLSQDISLDNDEQEFSYIKLKSCCLITGTTPSVGKCEQHISIPWDVLQQYRLPEDQAKGKDHYNGASKFNHSLPDGLNCRNAESNVSSLSVPIWTDRNATKKGFFSFFSRDGYFQFNEYVFSPDEYCIYSITTHAINVLACDYTTYCSKDHANTNNGDIKPCLFRCCDYGEVWDISGTSLRCTNSGVNKWRMHYYSDLNSNNALISNANGDDPVVLTSHPRQIYPGKCPGETYTFQISNPTVHEFAKGDKFGKSPFKILTNGSVWMKTRKLEWIQLNPGEYCVDGFQRGEGNFTGDIEDSLIFECKVLTTAAEVQETERQRKYSLGFGIIIFFCLMFLLMTTAVYILLWSKHNIHGWTIFSYIVTLLITYFLLGASHFASITLVRQPMHGKIKFLTFCGLLGILCHFFFLCTFAWSTVLSFDLFCTFRTLRPTRNGKSSGLKKFLLYCLFALAVPTCIVACGILLDIIYSAEVLSDVITPEYGKSVCYVEPRYARFYFVILPIAILLGINFLLFCNTAYSVFKVKKSTQFASSSSTKKESSNQTFRLIMKLLLINGAVWVTEIVSWYLQEDYDQVELLSFILDVVNIMQAVAIFFLFVFKNDILESLRRKYPSLEGAVNAAFKLKALGRHHKSQDPAPSTSSTSFTFRTKRNAPVSSL